MTDLNKRSKKEQKRFYAMQREMNNFNTGERVMKTQKSPSRAMRKAEERKMLENY